MPRELINHMGSMSNDKLRVFAVDEPGHGGASHRYDITGLSMIANPAAVGLNIPANQVHVIFQNGGVIDHGVNGLTHEVLLAIVQDRLNSFQNGPFPCDENEDALMHVSHALDCLHARTARRVDQGTEGKLEERTEHGDHKFSDSVHKDSDQPNPQGGIRTPVTGYALMERMKKLDEAVKVASSPGNYDASPYMMGMANGMLLAQAVLNDRSPDYLTAPAKWSDDKPSPEAQPSSAGEPVNKARPTPDEIKAKVVSDNDAQLEKQKPVKDAENKDREPIKPVDYTPEPGDNDDPVNEDFVETADEPGEKPKRGKNK